MHLHPTQPPHTPANSKNPMKQFKKKNKIILFPWYFLFFLEATIDSLSERTLHSLNLSTNEDPSPASDTPVNGDPELMQNKSTIDEKSLNGDNELAQTFVKKPSYLGLACSISGYSGITRYDSKLREGFRSRDSSPGSRLITRESSPAGFR